MQRLVGFLFLLSLTGCSYIVDFYIFNSTDHTITIEYQPREVSEYEVFTTSPKVFEFGKKDEFTEGNNTNNFQFNAETNTITCELKSKQALWIGTEMNFSLDNEYAVNELKKRLVFLNITSGGKTLKLTGDSVMDQFKKIRKHIIGINIKQD